MNSCELGEVTRDEDKRFQVPVLKPETRHLELLSLPLTMAVKLALEARPETRWVGQLLGGGDDAAAQ